MPSFSVPALPDRVNCTPNWQPGDRFILELESRRASDSAPEYRLVLHSTDGKSTQTFRADEVEALIQWAIAQQKPPAVEPPPTPPQKYLLRAVIEALSVQIPGQPEAIATAADPLFSGVWPSQTETAIATYFRIEGLTASEINHQQTTYQAHLYARNCMTLETTQLSTSQLYPILSIQPAYKAKFSEIETLSPGRYRLQVLVAVGGLAVAPAYLEIPVFTVV
jgi:hypothetical protein